MRPIWKLDSANKSVATARRRGPMRLLLVSDAWHPQVNGVAMSLQKVVDILRKQGDDVTVIEPSQFFTVGCPTYPEIRLALVAPSRLASIIEDARAHYIHIATEGPLGHLARRYCLKHGLGYTTSYHTRFPEYVSARFPIPQSWLYALVRRFHNGGLACMVATCSLQDELNKRGFRNLVRWSRGVNSEHFRPRKNADLKLPRPVFLYVGRVAIEKNIEAFISLDLPGSKVVVGDGPALKDLSKRYQDVTFPGLKQGEALAQAYAASDVFVFPSLTDTFGNVMLEALSSGLPVAAFPVTGPKDVIRDPKAGVLDKDLRKAALAALELKPADARDYALQFSWEGSAEAFRENILLANSRNAAGV